MQGRAALLLRMQRVMDLYDEEGGGCTADMQQHCSSTYLLVAGALLHLHMAHCSLRRLLEGIAPLFWGVVQHALNLKGELEKRVQVGRHAH